MQPKPSSLLWRLDHELTSGSSYLFGTMHVRDSRAFAALEPVYAAIAQCDAFATEFNLEEATPVDFSTALQLPPGQTLHHLVGQRRYSRLQRMVRKTTGVHLDHLSNLLPFAIINIIDSTLFASDHAAALDEHLWNFAQKHSKQMQGLETLAEQMEVLRQIPLAYQLKSLLDLSRNLPQHRKQMNHVADLYVQGNIRQLYQSSRKSLGPFRKLMLYKRNRVMAERIHETAQHTTLFAAVGAAHLSGGHGMLRMLKQLGWKTTPIHTGIVSKQTEQQAH